MRNLSKRKVFLVANSTWNIVNFRVGLVRALREQGYDVTAVAPQDHSAEPLNALGCRHIAINFDRKSASVVGDALLLYRYWRLLRRERPSVVLGFTVKPNIYASLAASALGIPIINNLSGLGTAFIHDDLISRVVKQLYRVALSRSYRVFFQNPDDLKLFEELRLVRHDQSVVLPGSGVDLDHFAPVESPAPGEGKPFNFLMVSRLLWDKGVGEFVEAAREIKRERSAVSFRILGPLDPQNRTAVGEEQLSRWQEEGVIDYLGSTDDVRPHIAASHCVVLPSYREGTPRSLLEAAAMSRPLIATDVPGCHQVVEDRLNGFLCQARNSVDLASAMRRMLAMENSDRIAMGCASRQKVEREYSESIVIEHYLRAVGAALSK